MHVHAAVNSDRLAGHEVAIVGRKEDHRANEILRVLITMEGAPFSSVGELFGRHHAFLIGARNGQAGHDRIHANIVVADFTRQSASKPNDCRLRGHVV